MLRIDTSMQFVCKSNFGVFPWSENTRAWESEPTSEISCLPKCFVFGKIARKVPSQALTDSNLNSFSSISSLFIGNRTPNTFIWLPKSQLAFVSVMNTLRFGIVVVVGFETSLFRTADFGHPHAQSRFVPNIHGI